MLRWYPAIIYACPTSLTFPKKKRNLLRLLGNSSKIVMPAVALTSQGGGGKGERKFCRVPMNLFLIRNSRYMNRTDCCPHVRTRALALARNVSKSHRMYFYHFSWEAINWPLWRVSREWHNLTLKASGQYIAKTTMLFKQRRIWCRNHWAIRCTGKTAAIPTRFVDAKSFIMQQKNVKIWRAS